MLVKIYSWLLKDGLYPQTNPGQSLIRVKDADGVVWEITARKVI